ncbi:Protein of unknown function [Gryllus bimaculatus]|nr:Protein of unknown function [Gryllus bimaculatus]
MASGPIPNDDSLSSEDFEDSPGDLLGPDEINAVDGELPDDELGDGEAMDGEETVVFRPLFVHRQRQARRKQRRLEQQGRWNAYYRTHYTRHLPRIHY